MPSTLIIVENDTVPADSRVWAMCLSLRRAGWEITVISPKGTKRDTSAFERIDGVDIHRFQTAESSGSALGYVREYVLAFAASDGSSERSPSARGSTSSKLATPLTFCFLTALRLRRQGAAAIFDQHDLSPELHAAKYEKGFVGSRWALVLIGALAFSLADVTLAMNESFRDVAVRRGRQVPENVFIVRNGPDLELFEPVDPDPALRSGSEHLIGYVGMMNSQDGVDLAVEALAELLRRRSDWHTVFVGDGDVLPDAERAVQRLGLQAHVTFTGFVRDRARLAQIISTCDVCLSPEPRNSLNEKSTLVKVAEYMAVGRPVVAFDLPETRRTAGEAAVYAERDDAQAFAEAIDGLLSDPERRARMGRLGNRTSAKRTSGGTTPKRQLIEAYARALERATLRVGRRCEVPAPRGSGRRADLEECLAQHGRIDDGARRRSDYVRRIVRPRRRPYRQLTVALLSSQTFPIQVCPGALQYEAARCPTSRIWGSSHTKSAAARAEPHSAGRRGVRGRLAASEAIPLGGDRGCNMSGRRCIRTGTDDCSRPPAKRLSVSS